MTKKYQIPEKLLPGAKPQHLWLLVHETDSNMWFLSTNAPSGAPETRFAGYPLEVKMEGAIFPGDAVAKKEGVIEEASDNPDEWEF